MGEVKEFNEGIGAGRSIRGIVQELDASRNTVRRFLMSPQAPAAPPWGLAAGDFCTCQVLGNAPGRVAGRWRRRGGEFRSKGALAGRPSVLTTAVADSTMAPCRCQCSTTTSATNRLRKTAHHEGSDI